MMPRNDSAATNTCEQGIVLKRYPPKSEKPVFQRFLEFFGDYVEVTEDLKYFSFKDDKINGQSFFIRRQIDLMDFTKAVLRDSGWIRRVEFNKRMVNEYKITHCQADSEISEAIQQKDLWHVKLNNAEYLKLSPQGDFKGVQEAGPPMYV